MKYDLIICQQPAKNIVFYFSQRPEAPHGSTRPFWETGRPTSSAFTVPPNFGTISTPMLEESGIRVDQEEQRIIRKQLYTQLY